MLTSCILLFLLYFLTIIKIKKILHSKLALFTVRRSPQREMMGITSIEDRLPRELVSNVLSRLPAKDLLKCKFVCKSWFDLITDPHFIANYYIFYNNLMLSQTQEEHLLVIRKPFTSTDRKTYISLLSWKLTDGRKHVSSTLLDLPDEYNSEHNWNLVGPCNGIYFLQGNPYVMMNPSLGQFKALPQSQLSTSTSRADYSLTDYAEFGFDPKTNDYKVVVIKDLWLIESGERQIGYWTAELYSLNSNSWRKLDAAALPLPIEIWDSSRVYTYVNNCCHWFGFVDEPDCSGRTEDVVLAFDMVNEFFRKIKLPKIRYSSEKSLATLVPFTESATIGVVVRGSEKCFDVWVMKNYWDEGSWTKQYSVGPIPVMIHKQLVGFYGSNKFLWRDNDERLVLYDPESKVKTKDLQVCGRYDSIRASRYMESLVSLRRGKGN